jgi:hypothetical protein
VVLEGGTGTSILTGTQVYSPTLTFTPETGAEVGQSDTVTFDSVSPYFSNSTVDLSLTGPGVPPPGTSYTLIPASSAIDPGTDGLVVDSDGEITGGLSIASDSSFSNGYLYVNKDDIDFEAVPEPSLGVMLAGGLGLLLFRSWRRGPRSA